MASLLPVSSTTQGFISYFTTTTAATAAAAVAEGGTKPLSDYAVSQTTVGMTKIAHRIEVTEEVINDYGDFLAVLQGDLVAGLLHAENDALLNFDATRSPETFSRLLHVTGTLTAAPGTGESALDALENGFNALRTGARFVEPDGVVVHPNDFSAIRKIKTTHNQYIFGDPVSAGPNTVWGVPVKLTTQCPQGTAIAANFALACMLYMREGVSLRMNNQGDQLWATNKVSVIAEERFALTVPAPAAICKVTLAGA